WFVAPGHAAKAADQRVEMAILHPVDAAKVGNNPMARLPRLVPIGLDELQVAPFTAFADPNKHTYRILQLNHPGKPKQLSTCDYRTLTLRYH
ncbi:hypothetical protein SAMN05421641_14515, partial [Paracoccus thiocyanatus]